MTYMLPAEFPEEQASNAERVIFHRLRDGLSDQEWCALHSLGMTSHAKKPWAEVDFVLIGPDGVFCLEVKGGGVARERGVWTTTNRHGVTNILKESPFSQVGSAASALHNYLRGKVPSLPGSVTGYGVLTPDVVFSVKGPDIQAELVYDANDADAPFADYVGRLCQYWKRTAAERRRRAPNPLDRSQRALVLRTLLGDFELRASLRSEIGAVREEVLRLTEEQNSVLLGLADNERLIVTGGAGTGKTLLALEEARRLADHGCRVLLTCFNRRLADSLKRAFRDYPGVVVENLHRTMKRIVTESGLDCRLPDAEPADLFGVFYPELCAEALLNDPSHGGFDALIVDEGQDLLRDAYVDVFGLLLNKGLDNGCWRVFMDASQDVFSGIARSGLEQLQQCKPTRLRLHTNCRNTKDVAVATSLLSGVPRTEVLRVSGGTVETLFYTDQGDERRRASKIIRTLLHRGLKTDEVVVLSTRTLERSSLCDGLVSCPVGLVDPRNPEVAAGRAIGFATISSFKGLECDAVVLVDLHKLDAPSSALDVYIGASRARTFLAVLLPETEREVFDRLAFEFGRRSVEHNGIRDEAGSVSPRKA